MELGPLGDTLEYQATPAGTADIFGNGPYDLILTDEKVLPFKQFLPDGTSVYGLAEDFDLPSRSITLLQDQSSSLWGLFRSGPGLRLTRYVSTSQKFETGAKSDINLPKNAGSLAATLSPRGRLLVYFSVSDGQAYNPANTHHHADEFRPFDGAGIWRGGLPVSSLGSVMFQDGTELGKYLIKYPVFNDEQNVLRRIWRIDDYNVKRGEVLRLTTGEPIQTHSRHFAGQLGRTKIPAIDWDGDGKIDLLTGTGRSASIPGKGGIPDDTNTSDERQSSVLLLPNAGTNEQPVFEYPKVVHFDGKKIALGAHSCSPLAVDLGWGQLDLLVGMERGGCITHASN